VDRIAEDTEACDQQGNAEEQTDLEVDVIKDALELRIGR